jgi:hypothetical protein
VTHPSAYFPGLYKQVIFVSAAVVDSGPSSSSAASSAIFMNRCQVFPPIAHYLLGRQPQAAIEALLSPDRPVNSVAANG